MSCGSKSRLFACILRKIGIDAKNYYLKSKIDALSYVVVDAYNSEIRKFVFIDIDLHMLAYKNNGVQLGAEELVEYLSANQKVNFMRFGEYSMIGASKKSDTEMTIGAWGFRRHFYGRTEVGITQFYKYVFNVSTPIPYHANRYS